MLSTPGRGDPKGARRATSSASQAVRPAAHEQPSGPVEVERGHPTGRARQGSAVRVAPLSAFQSLISPVPPPVANEAPVRREGNRGLARSRRRCSLDTALVRRRLAKRRRRRSRRLLRASRRPVRTRDRTPRNRRLPSLRNGSPDLLARTDIPAQDPPVSRRRGNGRPVRAVRDREDVIRGCRGPRAHSLGPAPPGIPWNDRRTVPSLALKVVTPSHCGGCQLVPIRAPCDIEDPRATRRLEDLPASCPPQNRASVLLGNSESLPVGLMANVGAGSPRSRPHSFPMPASNGQPSRDPEIT